MQRFCNARRVRNLLLMVLKFKRFLKLTESIVSIHPHQAAQAQHQLSPHSMVYTLLLACHRQCQRRALSIALNFHAKWMSTSDSWQLTHNKLHHLEHLQVAQQKNLTIHSLPLPVQHHEFNANTDSIEDLDAFPYLQHFQTIAETGSHRPHPPLPPMQTFPGAGTPLSNYIAAPWERDTEGCLEKNLQNNPYYLFATCKEYKYIQCGNKQKGMKTYNDNMLKEENTTLRFPSFKNTDDIQKLMARMPDDQALRKWELGTPEDMRWNDNHQCPIKYWSRNIIKTMGWLMRPPAYAEHFIYAPQHYLYTITPPKHLHTKMHSGLVVGHSGIERYQRIITC